DPVAPSRFLRLALLHHAPALLIPGPAQTAPSSLLRLPGQRPSPGRVVARYRADRAAITMRMTAAQERAERAAIIRTDRCQLAVAVAGWRYTAGLWSSFGSGQRSALCSELRCSPFRRRASPVIA